MHHFIADFTVDIPIHLSLDFQYGIVLDSAQRNRSNLQQDIADQIYNGSCKRRTRMQRICKQNAAIFLLDSKIYGIDHPCKKHGYTNRDQ